MAKKNFLKIIRELDAVDERAAAADDDEADDVRTFNSAEEYYSHPDQYWTPWVCNGDKDNVEDWDLEYEGTFDECLQVLANWISVEVDLSSRQSKMSEQVPNDPALPVEHPGIELEQPEHIARWQQQQSQKRKEIRQQCMTSGRFDSPGSKYSPPWSITCGNKLGV